MAYVRRRCVANDRSWWEADIAAKSACGHDTDMKRLLVFGALAGAATLTAIAAPARRSQLPLVVNVTIVGDRCQTTVDGNEVTSSQLLELGRTAKRRRAIVVFDKKAPYRCIGRAMFDLQGAGLTNIDTALWTGD